jgi:hypothetical protein
MKYILMMTGNRAGVDAYRAWSPGDVQTHFAHLKALNRDLIESGELVDNQRLTPPEQARVVRAAADGEPVTDGVFPESKEFLLGYWIVDVESAERAHAIAARLSGGPGPGGARLSMPIEVRELMTRTAVEL